MIEIKNLEKAFGTLNVLKGMNLTILMNRRQGSTHSRATSSNSV